MNSANRVIDTLFSMSGMGVAPSDAELLAIGEKEIALAKENPDPSKLNDLGNLYHQIKNG